MTLGGPVRWPTLDGNELTAVYGTVPSGTASVEIDFPDGTQKTLAAQNGGFLYAAERTPPPRWPKYQPGW